MRYEVVKFFTDLQDNEHPYNVGDTFPRVEVNVSASRLEELAGSGNRQGVPLIRAVEGEPKKVAAKRKRKTAEK